MARTDDDAAAVPRRGRQPALDPETERRAILDATLRVLRRSGYDRATLDEVLAEASLSTRAFYRHYSSKDELLAALFREETRSLASRIEKAIAAAADPIGGLTAWIDEILAITYEQKRSARAGLLRATGAGDAAAREESRRSSMFLLTEPLQDLLADGLADGTFPDARPEVDARTIYTITFGLLEGPGGERQFDTGEGARDHLLRYVLPALGVAS